MSSGLPNDFDLSQIRQDLPDTAKTQYPCNIDGDFVCQDTLRIFLMHTQARRLSGLRKAVPRR